MICFSNDTDRKSFRNVAEFSRLHWRLISRILPAIQEEMRKLGTNTIITSVWRDNSRDHREHRGVDVRVWNINPEDRMTVERRVNDKFPVPSGERPTIKYYHPDNSSYPHHFHVRVPAGGGSGVGQL
jgi:hypothetical protein